MSDTRSFYKKSQRKSPKTDLLQSISSAVILLLKNLYPLTEQVSIINCIDKEFSISNSTYTEFLKKSLPNDFLLYKKNRFLLAQIPAIKECVATYPNQPEAQFKHLDIDSELSIALDDYKFFLDNYYFNETNHITDQKP